MLAPVATCPPHHWWVEELPGGLQHWACYRCGQQRELDAQPADRPCVTWAPRQGAGAAGVPGQEAPTGPASRRPLAPEPESTRLAY